MFLDGDGKDVDWIRGYTAPPEIFHEKIKNVLKAVGTFKTLSEKYALNPKDVPIITELARKYENRIDRDKAAVLFGEVLALDPDGKQGTIEYDGNKLTCTECAEFSIALYALIGSANRSPEPLKAFAAKYPSSPLARDAYARLAGFYDSGLNSQEAFSFLREAMAKYPEYPFFKMNFLRLALYKKENLDEAIGLADKWIGTSPLDIARMRAELLALKGELSRAESKFGAESIESYAELTANNLQIYAGFWIRQKKNLKSAEEALRMAIRMYPDNVSFRRSLADFLVRNDRSKEAAEVFGPEFLKTAALSAEDLTVYSRFWADNKSNLGSVEEALEKAIEAAPEDGPLPMNEATRRLNAAKIYIKLGKPEKALRIYGPSFSTRLAAGFGLRDYAIFWAQQKMNLDDALDAMRRVVEKTEADWSWSDLASVYQAADRLEDARAAIKKAIELDQGKNASYYTNQLIKIEDAIAAKTKK